LDLGADEVTGFWRNPDSNELHIPFSAPKKIKLYVITPVRKRFEYLNEEKWIQKFRKKT
jgi:hypothetical protein